MFNDEVAMHATDDAVRTIFRKAFAGEPDVVASAPGRVNLIGEHLDYNGGEVLPIAITRRTTVAVRATPGAFYSRAVSTTQPPGTFNIFRPVRTGGWWDYIVGVTKYIDALPQFEIAVVSDVPIGAGLSSSAALEVATAAALTQLTGNVVTPEALALIGWKAESIFVGVGSGIMDQFASALGKDGQALHIWCDTQTCELVPFNETVLVFDTMVPRELRGSAFNERRGECEQALALLQRFFPDLPHLAAATLDQLNQASLPNILHRRVLHVVNENARVRQVVSELKAGRPVPGHLFYESHESLRELYECSSPELDWFVDYISKIDGVHGARLTGAGWGGCAIAIGNPDALNDAAKQLQHAYKARFSREPRVWLTRAGAGAGAGSGV